MSVRKAIDKAVSKLRKSHGAAAALRLGEGNLSTDVREVIPTGLTALDWYAIGCGGLPIGRISEIFSPEAGGKTSFALGCLAACQRDGGVAVLSESEDTFETERALAMGVNPDELLVLKPECLEHFYELVNDTCVAIGTDAPILIVHDSLASIAPKASIEDGISGKEGVGEFARVQSQRLKKLTSFLLKQRAHCMFINQIRHKIGAMFGSPETTPGGNALKYYASLRIRLGSPASGGRYQDKGDPDTSGRNVAFRVAKNKMGIPYREIVARLSFREGWDDHATSIRLAKDWGLLPKNTSLTGEDAGNKARGLLEAVEWNPIKAREKKAEVEAESKNPTAKKKAAKKKAKKV